MIIHFAVRDKQHKGVHDAPRCNLNLGIYHSQYILTDDKSKVTCKKCLKFM